MAAARFCGLLVVTRLGLLWGRGCGVGQMMGGLLAGTCVATPNGWRAVEALVPGDTVLTFAAGPQALVRVERLPLPDAADIRLRLIWPLQVPVGAMSNLQSIVLLPRQRVLIESDAAEGLYGQPFVLVPAAALLGFRGIDLCRVGARPAYALGFATGQIIYGGRGMLLHCPSAAMRPTDEPLLTMAQARALVAGMMAEDLGRSLRQSGFGGQAAFTCGAKRL